MRVLPRSKPVYSLAFLQSGPEIAFAQGSAAGAWDYTSPRPKAVRSICPCDQPEGQVRFIARLSAGDRLAVASPDRLITVSRAGNIRLWGPGGTPELGSAAFENYSGLTAAAISPDGSRIAIATGTISKRDSSEFGRVRVLQVTPEGDVAEEVGLFQIHSGAVRSLAFDPAGSRLLLGTTRVHALSWAPNARGELDVFDARVRTWDNRSGRRQKPPLDRPGHAVAESVAFSPDGSLLATAGEARILLWDPATGRWLGSIVGLERDNVLAFTPAGEALASAGRDGLLRIWDPSSGRERARFDCGLEGLNALAFSPDGTLVAAGGDRGIALIELDTDLLG
jgi:WD40 repeat protein